MILPFEWMTGEIHYPSLLFSSPIASLLPPHPPSPSVCYLVIIEWLVSFFFSSSSSLLSSFSSCFQRYCFLLLFLFLFFLTRLLFLLLVIHLWSSFSSQLTLLPFFSSSSSSCFLFLLVVCSVRPFLSYSPSLVRFALHLCRILRLFVLLPIHLLFILSFSSSSKFVQLRRGVLEAIPPSRGPSTTLHAPRHQSSSRSRRH